MSISICYEPWNPEKQRRYIDASAPSFLNEVLEGSFGALPIVLRRDRDMPIIRALIAARVGGAESIAEALEKYDAIRLFVE